MTEPQKQILTQLALDEGYTEDEIQKMLEAAEVIFKDMNIL